MKLTPPRAIALPLPADLAGTHTQARVDPRSPRISNATSPEGITGLLGLPVLAECSRCRGSGVEPAEDPASIVLWLAELPPSVNGYWVQGKRGRYISKAGQRFRAHFQAQALEAFGLRPPVIAGPVSLSVTFEDSSRRRWDLDNKLKAILDCCELVGFVADDAQIRHITAAAPPQPAPQTRVRIVLSDDRREAERPPGR